MARNEPCAVTRAATHFAVQLTIADCIIRPREYWRRLWFAQRSRLGPRAASTAVAGHPPSESKLDVLGRPCARLRRHAPAAVYVGTARSTCATSRACRPPMPLVWHSLRTLPSSSATSASHAYSPPPQYARQRSTRLPPCSVRLACSTYAPPPAESRAAQSAIVLSTSTALAPKRTASPPVQARNGPQRTATVCGTFGAERGREGQCTTPRARAGRCSTRGCPPPPPSRSTVFHGSPPPHWSVATESRTLAPSMTSALPAPSTSTPPACVALPLTTCTRRSKSLPPSMTSMALDICGTAHERECGPRQQAEEEQRQRCAPPRRRGSPPRRPRRGSRRRRSRRAASRRAGTRRTGGTRASPRPRSG